MPMTGIFYVLFVFKKETNFAARYCCLSYICCEWVGLL